MILDEEASSEKTNGGRTEKYRGQEVSYQRDQGGRDLHMVRVRETGWDREEKNGLGGANLGST